MNHRRSTIVAVIVCFAVIVLGIVVAYKLTDPLFAYKNKGPVTITVTDDCSKPGGFHLQSTGFTEGGRYRTTAWGPDFKRYPLVNDGYGDVTPGGGTKNWSWDCQLGVDGKPDPEGLYTIQVEDLSTGRSARATFKVKY